jgi:hypothetical protein
MLANHAEGLSYIQARTAEMDKIYEAARVRIMELIIKHASMFNAPYTGKYLAMLSEQLQNEYSEFEEKLRSEMKYSIPYLAKSYYFMALNDLGIGGKTSILGNLDKQRIKYFVESSYNDIAGATKKMRDVEIMNLRNISAKVFRETSLTGETRATVSRRLLSEATSLPGFRFVDKSGNRWDSKTYFDMLGRTVLMNAGRSSYLDACAANGNDIVRVTISGNPCPRCRVFENRLLSISGKTPGLPTVDYAISRGLFHPNCTHSLVAVPPAMVAKYYNEAGRANTGINSPGNETVDNPEAWKQYRREHALKGNWLKEPLVKIDQQLERSIIQNTLPPLNPSAPNAVSAVSINGHLSENTNGAYSFGSNGIEINANTAKRVNNFLTKYRSGNTDNIMLDDLRGMKTLCHEINHSRQHPAVFNAGTAGRCAIELVNEEYTLSNFGATMENIGFETKPEWRQLLTEKGYAYQDIVKNTRAFADLCGIDFAEYQEYIASLANLDGNDKITLLKTFFNRKLKDLGYNNSIGLEDIFNGDGPQWLKQHKK